MAQKEVLFDGHLRDQAELLKHDADTFFMGQRRGHRSDLAAKQTVAAIVKPLHAADDLDQGRLSRPVLAKQDMDFSGAQFKLHVLQRVKGAIGFVEIKQLNEGLPNLLGGMSGRKNCARCDHMFGHRCLLD